MLEGWNEPDDGLTLYCKCRCAPDVVVYVDVSAPDVVVYVDVSEILRDILNICYDGWKLS
jgi:hypothetical protein